MRLALALATTVAASISAREPLTIALLREDGFLVPVVTVRGDQYLPLTTADSAGNKSSFASETERLAGEWRWWHLESRASHSLRTLNRAFVHNHCSLEEAWQTTVKGKAIESHVADIKKVGVAIRNGDAMAPEDLTDRPDAASRGLLPLIVSLAHSREAERLRSEPKNPIHQFDHSTRAARAVIIEKLIRHQDAGLATYYFEAAKKYGDLRAFTTGWLIESSGAVQPRDVTFQMDDDGYKENQRATVLNAIKYAGKQLWLLVMHHYAGESYAIREWPSGRMIDNLGGGGC